MSFQDELQSKFLGQFLETASGRLKAATNAATSDDPPTAVSELHALAGEASMLGFSDIGNLAREAEQVAMGWRDGDGKARVQCGRQIRRIRQALSALTEVTSARLGAQAQTLSGHALVIDDSDLTAARIAEGLTERGLSVDRANNEESARASVKSKAPNLILTDVNMPGVDLPALCANLKETAPDSCILLMSSMQDDALSALRQKVSADATISKQAGLDGIVERALDLLSSR
jgi:CheY-like chemotaxis protein